MACVGSGLVLCDIPLFFKTVGCKGREAVEFFRLGNPLKLQDEFRREVGPSLQPSKPPPLWQDFSKGWELVDGQFFIKPF